MPLLNRQLVINVGDMLSSTCKLNLRYTKGESTKNFGELRYSIPFFMHPVSDMFWIV
jgi:isopenicillin N synthase-like dioxygenase